MGPSVASSLLRRSFCVRLVSKRFPAMRCKEWGTPGKERRTQVHPEGG
jgi:hypothetical protein